VDCSHRRHERIIWRSVSSLVRCRLPSTVPSSNSSPACGFLCCLVRSFVAFNAYELVPNVTPALISFRLEFLSSIGRQIYPLANSATYFGLGLLHGVDWLTAARSTISRRQCHRNISLTMLSMFRYLLISTIFLAWSTAVRYECSSMVDVGKWPKSKSNNGCALDSITCGPHPSVAKTTSRVVFWPLDCQMHVPVGGEAPLL
jgi:hypothetical protein